MIYTKNHRNPLSDGYYITDGGLETTLVFHEGIELPHFAAFELLRNAEGRNTLTNYFLPYLELARRHNLNFVLDTPTWRANTDWGYKMGYSDVELEKINREAVAFIRGLKDGMQGGSTHIALNGIIGPRGDGYVAGRMMTPLQAKAYHLPQIRAFDREGADLISAMTINYAVEAVGIVLAAREAGIPAAISFTVETDGRLPSGESLKGAIEKTDRLTGGYAEYFMINCAHPEHFRHIVQEEGAWKYRIRGIRANASTKSHAELDACETLDTGDKCLLATGYRDLIRLLPNAKIFGGCCGTDISHIGEICNAVLSKLASVA